MHHLPKKPQRLDFTFPLFLLLALATRLLGFTTPSVWYDESVTIYRAGLPLMDFLKDTHDAIGYNLWELLMRPFVHGPLWFVRLPALACSIGACALAWLLIERLDFSLSARRNAAVGMIFLPGLLWMSQDARFYAAFSLAYIAALYCAFTGRWLGLGALAGLLFYIHPTGGVYALSALLVGLIAGMPFRQVLAASAIAGISWIPRLALLFTYAPIKDFSLWDITAFRIFYETVQGFFVNTLSHWSFLLAGVLIFLVMLVSIWKGYKDRTAMLLGLSTLLPLLFLVLESVLWKPAYIYRTAQPYMIPFCLLAGYVIVPRWESPFTWIVPALCGCLLLMGFASYNPATRGGNTQQTAARIRASWRAADVIVYEDVLTAGPYDYYLHDLPHCTQSPSDGWFEHCQALPAHYWLVSTTDQRPDLIPFAIDEKWQMPAQKVWYIQ